MQNVWLFIAVLWPGKWHLGGTEEHLPTQHGFDKYYGCPFSCDMGLSAWEYHNESMPPFKATPLPLLEQDTIIEQPINLGTLTQRYVNQSVAYMTEAKSNPDKPFVMYIAFNHVSSWTMT